MDSIREQAMQALEAHMKLMSVAEGYSYDWSFVTRAQIAEKDIKGKKAVLGIYEGDQNDTVRFPVTDCFLNLMLEFHIYREANKKHATILNNVLCDVQRHLQKNRDLNHLVIDLTTNGNQLTIDGLYDTHISGVLSLIMKYRHNTDDPRLPI